MDEEEEEEEKEEEEEECKEEDYLWKNDPVIVPQSVGECQSLSMHGYDS